MIVPTAATSRDKLASDLAGKRALVTGAAGGIGKAIAAALARHGVRVAVADLDRAKAERTAADLGGGAIALDVDVRRRQSVEAVFAALLAAWGGVDIVCANAGVSTMRRAVELTDEEWDLNFDVNTRGVFLTNQIAARLFLKQDSRGVIVNTASLAAKIGAPLLAHYSASKFAVLGWTQALARELAPAGIRVNAVCPGTILTQASRNHMERVGQSFEDWNAEQSSRQLLGRVGDPREVAYPVVFLASDEASFITGTHLMVDGGYVAV